MKRKILKIEVISQFVLTISFFLFFLYSIFFIAQKIELIYFGLLFLIGAFNLIGLVIRLFLVRSTLNFIYLISVLAFFILSFAIYYFQYLDFEGDADLIMKYLFSFGLLFNIYYIAYGYYMLKNWTQEKLEIKP